MFGAIWLRNHTALSDQLSCLGLGARVTSPQEEHSSGEGLWSHSGFNASICPMQICSPLTPSPTPCPGLRAEEGLQWQAVRAEQRAEETERSSSGGAVTLGVHLR